MELEFTVQYHSVIACGRICVIEDDEEKRRALYRLIGNTTRCDIALIVLSHGRSQRVPGLSAEASQEFEQTCQQMQGRMKLFGAV